MTPEQLIEQGRRLARNCVYLREVGTGPVAAVWYEYDRREVHSTGYRCWLTVDGRFLPSSQPPEGFISIFTDEVKLVRGQVEIGSSWPKRKGIRLYAHSACPLPPVNALLPSGSETAEDWPRSAVEAYEQAWMCEHPLYSEPDVYAVLGGWHFPWPDDDWQELLEHELLVHTLRDSEPWVEAWRTKTGDFMVMQRIT